jgi:hypothetical protein
MNSQWYVICLVRFLLQNDRFSVQCISSIFIFRVDFKELVFAQPLGNYRTTSQISNVQKCANLRIDSRIKRLISMMESIP